MIEVKEMKKTGYKFSSSGTGGMGGGGGSIVGEGTGEAFDGGASGTEGEVGDGVTPLSIVSEGGSGGASGIDGFEPTPTMGNVSSGGRDT
jgi:hypothetical protein